MNPKSFRARRGVLLLVILGLLAMFGLVAVAFVVLTGHAQVNARAVQRIEEYYDPPQKLCFQGVMQALRGTNNPMSRMGPHSLLEDVYGTDPFVGVLGNDLDLAVCGGQLFAFSIPDVAVASRRVGCVLTMLTGTAAGQSTRIVGISSTGRLQALAFEAGVPAPGDGYLISGVPFSGTGFGFNVQTMELDAFEPAGPQPPGPPSPWYFALLPNHLLNMLPPGGANEDYDAVDPQNMLLAAQVPRFDPTTGQMVYVATIPSLHRPALIQYFASQLVNQPDLLRVIMLRPNPIDHPNFTGSNFLFNPAWDGRFIDSDNNGVCDFAWDVDNDGDGYTDGVWVDLGMPVRSTSDGRLYKPLFSFLCVDVDGRLNLNAHGCYAQTQTGNQAAGDYYSYYAPVQPGVANGYQFAGDPPQAPVLPRGQGYGPAETNLFPLFVPVGDPASFFPQWYKNLLVGMGGFGGRYGEDPNVPPVPGMPQPGMAGEDPLSHNRHFDYVTDYSNFTLLTGYGSLPDLKGTLAIGLDVRGQPLYPDGSSQDQTVLLRDPTVHNLNANPYTWARVNDPYEIDLSRNRARALGTLAPIDNAFGVAELERLLRPFDRDASRLPLRLLALTYDPNLGKSVLQDRRHAITTESWDLPCPYVGAAPGFNFAGAMFARLRADQELAGLTDLQILALMFDLFPRELLDGLRMDINRLLGNGFDDDGDGVVDEPPWVIGGGASDPGELFVQGKVPPEEMVPSVDAGGNPFPAQFDHANDGQPTGPNDALARQIYARHLYVLAMALTDKTAWTSPQEQARALAQWAVNVVDFRDRDSIMTPFEYDENPFNGWDVDNVIGTATNPSPDDALPHRGLVWGCERPELVITETLAFHDRRTEDRKQHGYVYPPDPPPDPDNPDEYPKETEEGDKLPDLDSRFRPQGSLFVELFNPWTASEPPPGEFYRTPDGTWAPGVILDRTTAPGGQGSPVWRLIVVLAEDADKDPDDPDPTAVEPAIERSVYFAPPPPAPPGETQFYPDASYAGKIAPVLPGRYAVVGPGKATDVDTSKTYIGFQEGADPSNPGLSRRIELKPNPDPNVQQVAVVSSGGDATNDDLGKVPIQFPVAVVINRPHRLSISEPDGGYPAGGYDPATEEYAQVHDQPLDQKEQLPEVWGILMQDQTVPGYRIIHLQRLANPLMPYDKDANPYRTIDSMPIDLTTFNGVSDDPECDADGNPIDKGKVTFFSRERGEHNDPLYPNNLWAPEPYDQPPKANTKTPPSPVVGQHYFNEVLHHTLGYLNDDFQPFSNVGGWYKGDPQQPFPWLTWNNRPFVSHLELLLVPICRSSLLLKQFRLVPANSDPYDPPLPEDAPFPHLVNFFQSRKKAAVSAAPELHRLLEFVHVPSRFVGTTTQGNPAACLVGDHSFHPPFHCIPRYREPGRINLNTVFSPDVLTGLMNGFPDWSNPTVFWPKFVSSRRGPGGVADILSINPSYPTRFARPFRSSLGGRMVPPIPLPAKLEADPEVAATLLRPYPESSNLPLFSHASGEPYRNTARNAYFHDQGLRRLGNLVTTRSNVYAIWVTVGYFQVETWPGGADPAHPDGYALGQELGIETGEVKRHRAFYVFDRSIPVGFQRGQDLNVEKAILLKRFIE